MIIAETQKISNLRIGSIVKRLEKPCSEAFF